MRKYLFITTCLLLMVGCKDESEEINALVETQELIEEQEQSIDVAIEDTSVYIFFNDSWDVLKYTSSTCERSSGDCHELILNSNENPLYTAFKFSEEFVVAEDGIGSRSFFRVTYIDEDYIILENEASDNNEWDGTFIVNWLNVDEFIMSNEFYSTDSAFQFTDTFHLMRQ